MDKHRMAANTYQVETSGWDVDESFFVEKTELYWKDAEKTVHLLHAVRKGTVVFVRLIGIDAPENSFPVAYQAVAVSYQMQQRCYDVSLMQMLPRIHSELAAGTSLK